MLKVPKLDICIESPRQSEYVNIVSNEKENHYILGHGSYGRVYKAVYRDKPAAVKIIRRMNAESETSVIRESNIMNWNHENIIKILKITSLDDCFTIIMERYPGICLQQLLNDMKIPSWHRIKISFDVINGLRYCHAKNLVHLDVKPQNVFVAFVGDSSNLSSKTNYVCKLFDFGCSSFVNEQSRGTNQRGTIRYMSPDILQGFNIGLHDDIYSFGITMWQLKSNADPYCTTPSNEFVAYHVVKNNLRPDSRLKHFGANGKENETMEMSQNIENDSVNDGSSSYHINVNKQSSRALTPKTPQNAQKPLKKPFLSTGHVLKHIKPSSTTSTVSSNVVKKLDFNIVSNVARMPFSPRSANTNQSIKHKIFKQNKNTTDSYNIASLFKDSYQHLSTEHKLIIENSYESIYKQCWAQEAIKRPSSSAILEMLKSTFQLYE